MSLLNDFDTDIPTLFEPEYPSAPSPEEQFQSLPDPAQRTPGQRAHALIANKERFKESPGQRSAAMAFAALEQAEATDRQTAMIAAQNAILEQQLQVAERMLAAQRIANQLTFFSMTPADFEAKRAIEPEIAEGEPVRESVFTQMKRMLGIIAPRPTVHQPDEEGEDDLVG